MIAMDRRRIAREEATVAASSALLLAIHRSVELSYSRSLAVSVLAKMVRGRITRKHLAQVIKRMSCLCVCLSDYRRGESARYQSFR